jgi:hypothetical protein
MCIYKPHEFGKLINRTTSTLQRWDREGRLTAHRTPTNRRYYTHDQYLAVIGQKATSENRELSIIGSLVLDRKMIWKASDKLWSSFTLGLASQSMSG